MGRPVARWCDPTGAAHRRYGITGEGLYLIRPDGYFGFRTPDLGEDGLRSYLDGPAHRAHQLTI